MFDLGKLEFYFTEGELHTFVNGHKLKVTGHVSIATQYLIATRISCMSTSGLKCRPHQMGALKRNLMAVDPVDLPTIDVCTVRDVNNHCGVSSIFEQRRFPEHHACPVLLDVQAGGQVPIHSG